MKTAHRNIVQFKSPAFNVTQVQPHFINPCCFGEDVGRWLCPQLQAAGYQVTGPYQEDWGWYLECIRDGITHTLNIGVYEDEGGQGEWRIVLEQDRSLKERLLGRKRQIDQNLAWALHEIFARAQEVTEINWYGEDSRGQETDPNPEP